MSDLISRQAALDNAWLVRYKDEWHVTKTEQVVSVEDIEALPTIDPVKHGKWVTPTREGVVSYDTKAYAECSVCGKKSYLGWQDKYCRNCGALMEDELWPTKAQ